MLAGAIIRRPRYRHRSKSRVLRIKIYTYAASRRARSRQRPKRRSRGVLSRCCRAPFVRMPPAELASNFRMMVSPLLERVTCFLFWQPSCARAQPARGRFSYFLLPLPFRARDVADARFRGKQNARARRVFQVRPATYFCMALQEAAQQHHSPSSMDKPYSRAHTTASRRRPYNNMHRASFPSRAKCKSPAARQPARILAFLAMPRHRSSEPPRLASPSREIEASGPGRRRRREKRCARSCSALRYRQQRPAPPTSTARARFGTRTVAGSEMHGKYGQKRPAFAGGASPSEA